MNNTRRLTEGAVLLAIFSVLLLTFLYVPYISVVSMFFLPLPFIIFTVKFGFKNSAVFGVASLFISFIIGSLLAIPVTLLYGSLGMVVGYAIREKKGRFFLYISSTLTVSIGLLLQYIVSILFLDVNVIEETFEVTKQSFIRSMEILQAFGQQVPAEFTEENIVTVFDMLKTLFPSLLVVSSFIAVYLILLVCGTILKRFKMPLPERIPFREWKLPRSLIWYYVGVTLISFFVPFETGTFTNMAIVNLVFMLQVLFTIQGLSFVFFFAYNKRIAKAVPVIVAIFAMLTPIGLLLIRLLGIIDIGFDLRQRVNQSKS
ncbi:YybS family protein [Bacillus litorisediminis]|uniref:YybS family protein n=1 Tax=Bacillus litorisediminis TaxID=2922713 RepID=UPI001FAB633B|nr:YybS family protein [Bacillus litorisediminis]